ncbi:MAG: stalk domain-containing protein [Cellulosilyticaceae bacterium]
MKKLLYLMLTFLLVAIPCAAYPIQKSTITFEGASKQIPSLVKKGTTYLEVRGFTETTNLTLDYNPSDNEVYLIEDYNRLNIYINEGNMRFNYDDLEYGVFIVQDGRTYLPLRYICEKFGYLINYQNSIIHITKDPVAIKAAQEEDAWLSALTEKAMADYYAAEKKAIDDFGTILVCGIFSEVTLKYYLSGETTLEQFNKIQGHLLELATKTRSDLYSTDYSHYAGPCLRYITQVAKNPNMDESAYQKLSRDFDAAYAQYRVRYVQDDFEHFYKIGAQLRAEINTLLGFDYYEL